MNREPIFFCLSGPVASGKSSIAKEVVSKITQLGHSISTTTRDKRKGESEGSDYFFVSKQEFKDKLESSSFIEHAEFCGNFYGTERRNFDLAEQNSSDLILDIEFQGVRQLKDLYPERTVNIFVFPVNFAVMKQRLLDRGKDSEETIEKRLSIAKKEVEILGQKKYSDYLIINQELENSVQQAISIIKAERLRIRKNLEYSAFSE